MKKAILIPLSFVFIFLFVNTNLTGNTLNHLHNYMPDSVTTTKVEILVKGMTCGGCESHVCAGLDKNEGVVSRKVSYKDGLAIIEYDPNKTTEKDILKAIRKTGFGATVKKENGQ